MQEGEKKVKARKILEAIKYADEKHKGQKRDGTGLPYIGHLMDVAYLVACVCNDDDVVVASILHDIYEDTDGEYTEVKHIFGKKVADLVAEVSKPYNKLSTREGLIIKFADLLHNVADMPKEEWVERKIKMIKNG